MVGRKVSYTRIIVNGLKHEKHIYLSTYSIYIKFLYDYLQYKTFIYFQLLVQYASYPFCVHCPKGDVQSGLRGTVTHLLSQLLSLSKCSSFVTQSEDITSVLRGRLQYEMHRFKETFWASTPKQSTKLRWFAGSVLVRLIKPLKQVSGWKS